MSAVFDTGLQPERTLLAWRRTCLALAVGLALAVRYGGVLDPFAALWFGVPALIVVAIAYAATSLRYRSVTRSLSADPSRLSSGGRAIAAVAAVAILIAVAAAGYVVSGVIAR